MKKMVHVAAAIVRDGGRILATQRGHGAFRGFWEFPGGKVEEGENAKTALLREMREEMDADVEIKELVYTVEYEYPEFHLHMDCFFCTIPSGTWVLKEHLDARWLRRDGLDSVEWLPADVELIERLKQILAEEGEERKIGMKLGVTFEDGQIFQHFGRCGAFKIYTVENQQVVCAEVVKTEGDGHGALAGFLKERGVDTLICGGIGGGARAALAEMGIRLYPGASGDADGAVEAFLKGTLSYDADASCGHHGHGAHGHGGHGHTCSHGDGKG